MTAPARWRRHVPTWAETLALGVVALVPFLLSDPGSVSADSRQYLYLDPGSYLSRAFSTWDPSVAAGTVPHQHLGFLWPMGPWFWLGDTIGLPVWLTQRFWLATVAFVAGWGALRLARDLGAERGPAFVGALVYQLTPYQLAFTARFSVLLLPWAALPVLVLLTRRALREQTWRAPLLFGLVVATAGSVNASSMILVLIAPVVVLAAAVRTEGLHAVSAGARMGVAALGASAWWLGGLVVQARHGLPVLQLTENIDTVAAASLPDEVLRGLGNWIFTSTDGAATVVEQAAPYQSSTWVRVATIALPGFALAALATIRHHARGWIVACIALGTVVAAGPAPLGDPSRYGELWRRFSDTSSLGLALRNTPRAVPVIVLGVAMGIVLGLQHLRGRARAVAGVVGVGLVLVAIAPVLSHGYLSDDFLRPEDLPDHWVELAQDLDASGDGRVLEIPGINFAAYQWGNAVEPVLPGLVDRPTIAREVLPAGGAGTADLLAALDRRLQAGTLDPAALAPVMRLLGVSDVVVRGDLDSDRFGLRDPLLLVDDYRRDVPPGFRIAGEFGETAGGSPALLWLRLEQPEPRVAADDRAPVLFAGDGDGLVEAAAAGILDGRRPVLPAITLDETAMEDALERGASLVVSDTNRKRATTFFYTIVRDTGATERADSVEPDPTGYDVRFGPYAQAPTDEQTVAVHLGGRVDTSMAGGPEHPEDRAAHVADGDLRTAWRPRSAPAGQEVRLRYDQRVPGDFLRIVRTTGPAQITELQLTIDGVAMDVHLDDRASTPAGQLVDLPGGGAQEIVARIGRIEGVGAAGLAELGVGAATVDETFRLPTGLVDRLGDRAPADHSIVLARTRDVEDLPTEADIDRVFEVPVGASFEVTGTTDADVDAPCAEGLLTVDGASLAVRVDGGSVTACQPLRLDAGPHRLRTERDGALAEVDRIVLSAGERAPTSEIGLRQSVVEDERRHHEVRVDSAEDPFWFTIGESANDGWELSVEGGSVRSTSMLDGYSTAWLVEPDGADSLVLSATWRPQRVVWIGFAISAVALSVLGIVVWRTPSLGHRAPGSVVTVRPARNGTLLCRLTDVAGILGLFAAWWFVSTPAVGVLAVGAMAMAKASQKAPVVVAIAALGATFAAHFTDRPMLAYGAIAIVTGAIGGSWRRQESADNAMETPA